MLPSLLTNFRGEVAALGAALIWAVASVIYAGVGRQLPPLILNLAKGLIAIALLIFTLVLKGGLFPAIPLMPILLLSLSGVIGIGFGDTAYFQALNRLGARRTLVLESLAPPLAALLALIFLQEQLTPQAWVGIGLTLVGVTGVVLERTTESPESRDRLPTNPSPTFRSPRLTLSPTLKGIGFGLLAAIGQATGAVLSRSALSGTSIDPLWSALVRLVAGILVVLVWVVIQQPSPNSLKPLRSRQLLLTVTGTAFASTYLAIWLQQVSLKYAAAGIAQSLSATSPLFVMPIAIAMGEKISLRAILGVLVALTGIWLLFQ